MFISYFLITIFRPQAIWISSEPWPYATSHISFVYSAVNSYTIDYLSIGLGIIERDTYRTLGIPKRSQMKAIAIQVNINIASFFFAWLKRQGEFAKAKPQSCGSSPSAFLL